jgi:thiol-disulfide isomerase/thioredoxin
MIQTAGAVELFEAPPALPKIKWLKGPSFDEAKQPIRILYFWATWCVPCRRVRVALADLVKKYPDQIAVAAFSNEDEEVVQKYLATTYANEPSTFSYGLIDKDTSKPGSFENVPYFPYTYILKSGTVIWKGLAGYPKGETEKLIEEIVSGKWDEKRAREIAKQEKEIDNQIEKSRNERKKIRKSLIELEKTMLQQQEKKVAMDKSRYIPVQQELQTLVYLLWLYGDSERTKKEYDEYRARWKTVFAQTVEQFSSSRDEATFLSLPLLLNDDIRFRMTEIGRPLAEKAMSLPDDGQYGYLTYFAYAEAKALEGKYSEAVHSIEESMARAKSAGVTDFESYEKRLTSYREKLPQECFSFGSCLRSALNFLF